MSRGSAPDFALCGLFSGKTGQSAARWLKKVEWELERHAGGDESVDPARFLRAVDLLLADDAAVWAETTPGIVELLEDPSPTAQTVAQFKGLFNQQYPLKVPEASVVHFDSEIADLRQQDDETLITYYQRTAGLLSRVGGRDRPRETTSSASALLPLEAAMLDTVMRAFTRGIQDSDVRRDALRGLVASDRSLYGVYSISEESRRAKGEYAHLQEESAKAQELQFYREVVQINMPSTQINSLKASFHAQYMPQWGYPSQPAFQQAVSWSAPAYQSAPPYIPQSTQWPMPTLAPVYQSAPPYYAPRPFQQLTPASAPAPAPYRPPDAPFAPAPAPAVPLTPLAPTAPLFSPPSALFSPPVSTAALPPVSAAAAPPSVAPAAIGAHSVTYSIAAPPAVTSPLPAVPPALSAPFAPSVLSAQAVLPTPLAPAVCLPFVKPALFTPSALPATPVPPLPATTPALSALSVAPVPPALYRPPAVPLPAAVTPAPPAVTSPLPAVPPALSAPFAPSVLSAQAVLPTPLAPAVCLPFVKPALFTPSALPATPVPPLPATTPALSALSVAPVPPALYRPPAVPLPAAVTPAPPALSAPVATSTLSTLSVTPAPSAPPPVVSVRSITCGFAGLGVSNVVSSVKSTQVSSYMLNIELNKCLYVDTLASSPAQPTSPLRNSKTATIALSTRAQKMGKEEEEPG